MITKDQIWEIEDRKFEDVYIQEWGDTVRVAEIGADDRDELEQYLAVQSHDIEGQKNKYAHIRAALACVSIVDENMDAIFSLSDAGKMGKKNGKALDRIFEVSNQLNKIFGVEKDEVKKNLNPAPQDSPDGV